MSLRIARRYWLATRPGFLSASLLPIVVGTAWGHRAGTALEPLAAGLALLATAFVHAAANVLNDVADADGSDALNDTRIFPYTGGSRVIQDGVLSRRQMRRLGLALLACSAAVGLVLAGREGVQVMWFGLAGVVLALLYSLPPLQLAGRGVGELTVAIAFGVLPVTGAAWLQSGRLDSTAVLVSLPVAAWVAAILLINEVPDVAADAAAGKRTVPVRLGVAATRRIYLAVQLAALAAVGAAAAAGLLDGSVLLALPPLAALAIVASRGIRPVAEARPELTRSIRHTLAIHASGCLWLALWAWFAPR